MKFKLFLLSSGKLPTPKESTAGSKVAKNGFLRYLKIQHIAIALRGHCAAAFCVVYLTSDVIPPRLGT